MLPHQRDFNKQTVETNLFHNKQSETLVIVDYTKTWFPFLFIDKNIKKSLSKSRSSNTLQCF